ncbi:MAG: ComEC/Rec2 family competence protein [Solirubrobacterales bacterium]
MTAAVKMLRENPRHLLAASLAIGIASAQLPEPAITIAAMVLTLACLSLRMRLALALAACALLVAGGGLGQLRLAKIDSDPLSAVPRGEVELRGYLLEHPRMSEFGGSARTRVMLADGRSQTIEIRTRTPMSAAAIGAEVHARGSLRAIEIPRKGSPASVAYARNLLRTGVRRRLHADSVTLTGARRGGLFGVIDSIRDRSERTIATGLQSESAALLRGMVMGGDAGIPDETTAAFKVAGLSHILAVSGQNVLLLVILVQAIAGAAGMGRRPRIVIPIALICVYVPLCGAQASVVRAGVMGLAGLVALLASRPSARIYALLLSAIVVLAHNPRAVADVGAQLSFVAVLGIMAFARPVADRAARRIPRWAAEALGATAGATLTTAPLMAFHFGTVSIVSLAANVLGEPIIGPIVWLGSLAAAIGQISQPVGALLNAPNGFLLGSLISLAHAAASVPGAQVELKGFGQAWLALSYAPIVILAAIANGVTSRWGRARQALGWVGDRAGTLFARHRTLTLFCVIPAIGAMAWLVTPSPQGDRVPRPSIVFLDVGQGDAALLLGSDGCEALIDGGPPGRQIVKRLRDLGVERLELMIATHPQLDHDGGLGEIARAGKPSVSGFLDGGSGTADRRYHDLQEMLAAGGTDSRPAEAGELWSCADLSIEVLGPSRRESGAPPPSDPNTRAAVTLATVGTMRFFASGDAESPQLNALALPRAEIFKAPHHGSADPGLSSTLQRVGPQIALIGVGTENRFGHPTPQVLTDFAAAGVRVLRTDQLGDIVVSANSNGSVSARPLSD